MYVKPANGEEKAVIQRQLDAHFTRLDLIAQPFPPIMLGRVIPSYPWAGTLIGGRGPMRTEEEGKRGRRVSTQGPILEYPDPGNRSSYYADRATD